jgi:hypothetical protein
MATEKNKPLTPAQQTAANAANVTNTVSAAAQAASGTLNSASNVAAGAVGAIQKLAGGGSSSQRDAQCPFCASHVKKKDVSGGKKEFKIPFTNPPYRIPIPPFLAKLLLPDPSKCSCGGKKTVKDVSDDSAKYKQVQQKAEASIDKVLDLEAKLGTGGSRTTMVQASDTLYVGLGFNRNDSYETVPNGHFSPGKISADPKTGGAFAAGYSSNAVTGKQTSVGWPSANGTYSIKCANKYQLLTGAGGITMATKGPLSINAGIITLTGPQVTIGSSSGPLTLEGDVVSITGKTISLTPTDANVFVKGTISATGNAVFGGQVHAETLSFCKASCVGVEKRTTTEAGNPDTGITFPAAWGGMGVRAIILAVLDLQYYMMNILSEFETAAINLLAPTQMLNLINRFGMLVKVCIPIEIVPTGIFIGIGFGLVWNWPHVHGLPSMNHSHAVTVPDIDTNYSSPQALRAKVINDALTSNAPVVPSNKIQDLIEYIKRLPGFAINTVLQAQKLIHWILQTLS